MFNQKVKKVLVTSAVTAFALFGLSGCLEEKPLPTDELVTIYNSDMEKTNKMHPLDTMYAKIGGLKENSRYEIRVLDSNKDLITSSQVYSDENGVIEPTAIWYDIGVAKPTAENPTFHINKDASFKVNAFIVNVKDMYNNGNDTDFEQAFFYVPSKDAAHAEYPKPVVYACTSTGMIENAFEETGSKTIDNEDSTLTKIHLKVDTLPEKDYLNSGAAITDVNVYVVPFTGKLETNTTIADLNATVTQTNVALADLKSDTGALIWDLNGATQLINPDAENNAYSIIIDTNKDGIYTVGTDLDSDGVTDRYVDAVDGGNVPGFIVKNTPANELKYFLSDSQGNKISSVPESAAGSNSIYLTVDNISTTSASLPVTITGGTPAINKTVNVDVSTPTVNDKVRYLKYIDKVKIFNNIDDYNNDITAEQSLTVTIADLNITTNIMVYPIETNTTVHSKADGSDVNTTTFDETGTIGGDTSIYVKFGGAPDSTANVYLFDHNITWNNGTSISGQLASKTDLNSTNDNVELAFNLNSDVNITNPNANNMMYDVVVDYNKNGTFDTASDKKVVITIRNSSTNDVPNVGYINIASSGYFGFDNHYADDQNISMYGYIDEFKKDGSNTKWYPSQGVKAIWNPYIKNKKRVNPTWYNMTGGDVNTYIDYDGVEQPSPFNFDQQVNIYIIDASKYELKADMKLEDKDVRGYGSVHTVQYSCSNGARQQTIWRAPLTLGSYYVIIDIDKDGKITEGVDYIDAVDQTGKTIKEDSSVVGFTVVE